jgi:hypothetical protein
LSLLEDLVVLGAQLLQLDVLDVKQVDSLLSKNPIALGFFERGDRNVSDIELLILSDIDNRLPGNVVG